MYIYSLQKSMSKEGEIKREYEGQLVKCHQEMEQLTKQLNHVVLERNQLVQERSILAQKHQLEYERAER